MSSKITSLSDLIRHLKGATKEEYKSIGYSLDIPVKELLPYANWSEECYTRNCIVRENNFELLLLCWEAGQETPIHCHGGEECWVYLMDGKIEEIHFDFVDNQLLMNGKCVMLTGDKSFMSDEHGYHCLINNSTRRSLSLHLYMDPIDVCTFYDEESNSFIEKILSYYSYNGEVQEIELTD